MSALAGWRPGGASRSIRTRSAAAIVVGASAVLTLLGAPAVDASAAGSRPDATTEVIEGESRLGIRGGVPPHHVSGDGRYVLLVRPGGLFRYDRLTRLEVRVDVTSDDMPADGPAAEGVISDDGNVI